MRNILRITIALFVLGITTLAYATVSPTPTPPKKPVAQSSSFAGTWEVKGKNYEYSLSLKVHGKKLTGYHCAVTANGKHIDDAEADADEPSVNGTIKGQRAEVTLKSVYDEEAECSAVLELTGNTLKWRIVKTHGILHCIPANAVLHRKK